jgi:hypothetical protein
MIKIIVHPIRYSPLLSLTPLKGLSSGQGQRKSGRLEQNPRAKRVERSTLHGFSQARISTRTNPFLYLRTVKEQIPRRCRNTGGLLRNPLDGRSRIRTKGYIPLSLLSLSVNIKQIIHRAAEILAELENRFLIKTPQVTIHPFVDGLPAKFCFLGNNRLIDDPLFSRLFLTHQLENVGTHSSHSMNLSVSIANKCPCVNEVIEIKQLA